MKKLMPSEGLRLGCSSGSTRCVIAKNYVLGQPGGGCCFIMGRLRGWGYQLPW